MSSGATTMELGRCAWCEREVETIVHDLETGTLVCDPVPPCTTVPRLIRRYHDNNRLRGTRRRSRTGRHPQRRSQPTDSRTNRSSSVHFPESKRKYVTVTITLEYTDYQFTEDAIERLRTVFEMYEERAARQSTNMGSVEFDVPKRGRWNQRPHQRIVVDGLFEADAREFIRDVLPIIGTRVTGRTTRLRSIDKV